MLKKVAPAVILLFLVCALPARTADKSVAAADVGEDAKAFATYKAAYPIDYLKLAEWSDFMTYGSSAIKKKNFQFAERYFRKALQVAVQAKLPSDKLIGAMDMLCAAYLPAGKYEQAIPIMRSELALLPLNRELYDTEFNQVRLQLAGTYENVHKYEQAIELYKAVLVRDKEDGYTDRTRSAAFSLAQICASRHDQKTAEDYLRIVWRVTVAKKAHDLLAFDTARQLANNSLGKRDFKSAASFYKFCMSIPKNSFGIAPADWADVMEKYATALKQRGRIALSKQILKEKEEYLKSAASPHSH